MKKILSTLLIGLLVLPFLSGLTIADESGFKRKLLVTAYYSPLPDQSFYIKGSYEADIILNGRGTNGADGTEVYVGMLAAPKTYPFGTRVVLPGLGVGEVHDRGGAIIAGADYDRIDVWMGRGEEGLARALNWGARMIEGEVYTIAHQVEPSGFSFDWVSTQLPTGLVARLKQRTLNNPQVVVSEPVTFDTDEVKELQEALAEFGYYTGDPTGDYDTKTEAAVLAFQLAEGVIESESDTGAGHFGPMTRATLQEKLELREKGIAKEIQRLEENRTLLASGLGKDSEGESVLALQRMLWELGYYDGNLTGDYDTETVNAVYAFQTKNKIINDPQGQGAGYYGKSTHDALNAVIEEKKEREKDYPESMQVWVPAKQTLPQIAELSAPVVLAKQEIHFNVPQFDQQVLVLNSNLGLNDRGEEVVKLQNFLISQGYLASGLNTGYYGSKTREAVLKFQLDKGIVSSASDAGAGNVGPQTRSILGAA